MIRSVRLARAELPLISHHSAISKLPVRSSPAAAVPLDGKSSQKLQTQIFGAAADFPLRSAVVLKFKSLELGSAREAGGRRSLRTMASDQKNYHAQSQGVQPGIEHLMDPIPVHSPPYTPSNKLKVQLLTESMYSSRIQVFVFICV